MLALAGCGGGSSGPGGGTPRAALLALARLDSAPPASPAVFVFKNNQIAAFDITHTDSLHTVFAHFAFTPHSVVSRNDTLLADSSTIVITVTLVPGTYEFTVAPSTMVFNQSGEPTVSVSWSRYGDPSVYSQSSLYPTAQAFEQAVQLWRERDPDQWVEGRNSSHTAARVVASALESPGRYLLAAPK